MNQNIIEHIIKLENELKTFKTELKTLKEMMLAPINPVVKKNRRINAFRSARLELLLAKCLHTDLRNQSRTKLASS